MINPLVQVASANGMLLLTWKSPWEALVPGVMVRVIGSPDPFTTKYSFALFVEVLLTTCKPNSSDVDCTITSALPVPLKENVCGLPAAFVFSNNVPLNVPAAVGRKDRSMLQDLPGL